MSLHPCTLPTCPPPTLLQRPWTCPPTRCPLSAPWTATRCRPRCSLNPAPCPPAETLDLSPDSLPSISPLDRYEVLAPLFSKPCTLPTCRGLGPVPRLAALGQPPGPLRGAGPAGGGGARALRVRGQGGAAGAGPPGQHRGAQHQAVTAERCQAGV